MPPCLVLEVSVVGVAPDAVEDKVVFAVAVDLEHAVLNVPDSMDNFGLSEKKSRHHIASHKSFQAQLNSTVVLVESCSSLHVVVHPVQLVHPVADVAHQL